MPRPNITRFANLAIDPTLDEGNPYKIMRCPRVTTNEINKIPEDGLKGGEILFNTDLNAFQLYDGNAWTNPNVNKEILYGYVTTNYSDNLTTSDHIKFNAVGFERSSGSIALDITSPYSSGTGTASVGRITLQPNKTYKLTGSLNNTEGNDQFVAAAWYNSDTNTRILYPVGAPTGGVDRAPGGGVVAYFTANVITRIELRITWSGVTVIRGINDAIGPAFFTIETI